MTGEPHVIRPRVRLELGPRREPQERDLPRACADGAVKIKISRSRYDGARLWSRWQLGTFFAESTASGQERPAVCRSMPAVTAKGGCGPGKDTHRNHGLSVGARSRSLTALEAVQSSS